MSLHPHEHRHVGGAGWFTIGALAASLAFVALMIAGGIFEAAGTRAQPDSEPPALIVEPD
jgi:hypothetical protein